VIVDDMISTGGTIEAASSAVIANGAERGALVISTHGLFVGSASARLGALPVERFVVSDSVSSRETTLPISVVSLGSLLADAIKRLHENRSLSDLIVHE
jgi:ribose-phosphate pyrophosphokinase